MLRHFSAIILMLWSFYSWGQEAVKLVSDGPGISLGTAYTFSGISAYVGFEWQNKDHIFYTGPKLNITRTYLPFRNPFGWILGYRHDYNKSAQKKMSFFFNADYQVLISNSFSYLEESKKKNHIHEIFVGYGVQYKFSERVYLVNAFGIGGYIESYYNTDLNFRKNYWGYNNLFKFFLNYKF